MSAGGQSPPPTTEKATRLRRGFQVVALERVQALRPGPVPFDQGVTNVFVVAWVLTGINSHPTFGRVCGMVTDVTLSM
jgi:hypothetical protein